MKKIQFLQKNVILDPFLVFCLLLTLAACQSNELTPQELARQSAADARVAAVLFDHELDSHASYNVHTDGSVIIKFDPSVNAVTYTEVVDNLRAMPEIKSVYAEQSGRQVCPLKAIR